MSSRQPGRRVLPTIWIPEIVDKPMREHLRKKRASAGYRVPIAQFVNEAIREKLEREGVAIKR